MLQFELFAKFLQHPVHAVGVQLSAEALPGFRVDCDDISLTAFS